MNSEQDSKRLKISIEENDRISALPDHIIFHILSLLPTKDTARTSVLSNRWKDLFASVTIIDCDNFNPTGRSNTWSFIAFVYRLLYLIGLRLSRIHRFRINLRSKPIGTAVVSSWISTALSFNVQELILRNVICPSSITLPLPLFTCTSLTVLTLEGKFLFNVPHHVSLPSLNSLCLFNAIFQDDSSLRRLLSRCPVLEDLDFCSCNMENIKVFHMSSPSMKRLRIHCPGDYELFLDVPNLQCLNITTVGAIRCSGYAFKSLVEVSIKYTLRRNGDVSRAKIPEFLNIAFMARKLLLHDNTLKALAYAPHPLPFFHALTHLDLGVMDSEGWKLLPALLNSSPCLETLVLTRFDGNNVEFPLPHVPKCFHMHLKTIELNYFRGTKEQCALVQYVLLTAKVLENLKIYTELGGEDFRILWKRLFAFQTQSKTCTIALCKRY